MKWLKSYKQYKESITIDLEYQTVEDLMESLDIWHDVLLNAISAEEMNIYDVLSLPKEDYTNKMDIDYLEDNIEFINSLSSIGLKKSTVQNTDDSQTFVNKPCKFMFIYNSESNELENPVYIVFQVWNDTLDKWDSAKLYKINDDVKKFYDKLSSKTVEINDGDDNYIYQTSNGSDWDLQNIEKENDVYKKSFRKQELQDLLKDRNVKVSII